MYLQELRSRFSVSSRASLPSLYFFFDCRSGSRVEIFLPKRCPPIVSNWSVTLADSTSIFLIGTYEMFSRCFSTIRRFSRKTHKWLRTVFFLPVSRIVLFESFSGTPRFSTDFSQFSQFFCSLVELRTFLLKNSDFLVAAYLQKCFLTDSAGFFHLLLLRCCRWKE